jgi:hypothetical protein
MVHKRPPVPRPAGKPATFVCALCATLCEGDGVTACPTCGYPIDWVDLAHLVWCCTSCDAVVNDGRKVVYWPWCEICDRAMRAVRTHPGPELARPKHAALSFVCARCKLVLFDGVDYRACPSCALPVRWVDLAHPVWCCAACGTVRNTPRLGQPGCPDCGQAMRCVVAREQPSAAPPRPSPTRPSPTRPSPTRPSPTRPRRASIASILANVGFGLCTVGQLVVLALDPIGLAHIAPILILLLIAACAWLVLLFRSSGELARLIRDRRTRVIHGLEHATANVLEHDGIRMLQGRTMRGHFALELGNDGRTSLAAVRSAVEQAVDRVAGGEAKLALHPRCGTSVMLAVTSLALLIVASTALGVIRGVPAGWIVLWTATLALLTLRAARPAGLWAQRWLTVSTRFASARAGTISYDVAADGRTAVFLVPMTVELAPVTFNVKLGY